MNYLAHFVFNHDVCGLPRDPCFAFGVVLPDLWLRFSRRRRIRWKELRAAAPSDEVGRALRAGLLNHAAVDRHFHILPSFLRWQRQVRQAARTDGTHPALVDFLAHAAVELCLDQRLLREDPGRVDALYGLLSRVDVALVARRAGEMGGVDTRGLEDILAQFLVRRFLRHYATAAGLVDVLRIILSLAGVQQPGARALDELVQNAARAVCPATVWAELRPRIADREAAGETAIGGASIAASRGLAVPCVHRDPRGHHQPNQSSTQTSS